MAIGRKAPRSRVPAPSVEFPRIYRPTWAEIDLARLVKNLARLRARARRPLMLVVKADGYGHGAVEIARAAESASAAASFGVSSVEEGVALREAGLRSPILILGSLFPFESTLAAMRFGLTPTVASLDGARLIVRAAEAMERLRPAGKAESLACHLKIDTGMGRVGVSWPAGAGVARFLLGATGVRLDGIYTHLSCAETDARHTRRQLELFARAVAGVRALGLRPRLVHAANSAAALRYPASRWDLVRPGLAAYGLYPGFAPVLSLKSRLVFIKSVARGTPISYGALYRARRSRRIATLPIGYGDGLQRAVSLPRAGRPPAAVLVRGRRCPIVGAMTMDMTMVDVSGVLGAAVGDEAVLIGRSGALEISASELADAAGTIPYEVVTALKSRVPRVYLGG